MNVLMVITSRDQLGNTGRKTGFWLEELAAPLLRFQGRRRRDYARNALAYLGFQPEARICRWTAP